MKKNKFSSINKIISIAKKGQMYILVDDENRENEGDLVFCASSVNPKKINFMAKYGRGLICLALDSIQGHVFPIISKDGGVLVRAGHTEASVDISRLAGKGNSAVICEIMSEDGSMARGQNLLNFAKRHNLKIGKIEDLISYRLKKEKFVRLKKKSELKIENTKYRIKLYENLLDGSEHFALIKGDLKLNTTPRVRVISSNVIQNYLINQKIPNSFKKTLNYFKKFNNCVLVFIKDTNVKTLSTNMKKISTKNKSDISKDNFIRNYGIGAQIIKDLKIKKMILITRSPKKVVALDGYDIKITKQEIIR